MADEVASRLADLIVGVGGTGDARESTHNAKVLRIDGDGTAWVAIAGGADETPAVRSHVSASPGDMVSVTIAGGVATVTANLTSPAAPTREVVAAQATADAASHAATDAEAEARRAYEAAEGATASAASASAAAASAQSSAADANESATSASRSATNALMQLAVVQDVAGTLDWIRDHGSFERTQDVAIVSGKQYYALVGGEYVPVTEPVAADLATYYELSLDGSAASYIMSHVAITDAGLWVLPNGVSYVESADTTVVADKLYYELVGGAYVEVRAEGTEDPSEEGWYEHDPSTGYKALYGADGHRLYDGSGRLVRTDGESIELSSSRPQHIGGEDAYILYYDSDEDGMPDSLAIGGENVTIGARGLSEVLASVEDSASSVSALEDTVSYESGQREALARAVAEIAESFSVRFEATEGDIDALYSFMRVEDVGGAPRLTLGSTGAAIETRMTNDRLGFYAGPDASDDEAIASIYVDPQTGQGVLEVANAVVVSELRLGHWAWVPRKNGNLALKWIDELVDPEPEPDPGGDDDGGDGGGE